MPCVAMHRSRHFPERAFYQSRVIVGRVWCWFDRQRQFEILLSAIHLLSNQESNRQRRLILTAADPCNTTIQSRLAFRLPSYCSTAPVIKF